MSGVLGDGVILFGLGIASLIWGTSHHDHGVPGVAKAAAMSDEVHRWAQDKGFEPTDGPVVRLAKAAKRDVEWPTGDRLGVKSALADLAGPCGTCDGSGQAFNNTVKPYGKAIVCPTCNGTGTDPLARARRADRLLRIYEENEAAFDPVTGRPTEKGIEA
jgi:hypothetical protein